MKYVNAKMIMLMVILFGISILIGLAAHNNQSKLPSPITHLVTQTSSPSSTLTSTPVLLSLSAAELETFFGNTSCSWPCWQGITPGVVTSSEALKRLQESESITQSSLQSQGITTESGSANWYWTIGEKQPVLEGGHLEWRNGLVWQISLTAYSIISLGEIIEKFGPPEQIGVTDCSEIVERSPVLCAVLYYAKKGFEIHVRWENSGRVEDIQITPADPIDAVIMFEPSPIEEWLSSNGIDVQLLNLQDWKGYGSLLDLYY